MDFKIQHTQTTQMTYDFHYYIQSMPYLCKSIFQKLTNINILKLNYNYDLIKIIIKNQPKLKNETNISINNADNIIKSRYWTIGFMIYDL